MFDGMKPERPLYYFEEICKIPHGSGNVQMISDYIRDFAKARSLNCVQDEMGNVIIYKSAHKDYLDIAPVIIQGHIDMVCEKEEECAIDFTKDGLELLVEDREYGGITKKILCANGTTLGADDGVAVCYMLALLEDSELKAPALECVFTVDEEVGMLGAAKLDFSLLKGRTMINIDNEEENMILAGCAGGVTAAVHLPIKRETLSESALKGWKKCNIQIGGLTGGHSGEEIIKQRASANVLMGRTLCQLFKHESIKLISINGGLKDNAIPRRADAVVLVEDRYIAAITQLLADLESIYRREYENTDPGLFIKMQISDYETGREDINFVMNSEILKSDSADHAVAMLYNLPNGVQKMSEDIKGLVQTSLNMGILKTFDNEIVYSFSVRSSVSSEKQELLSRIECLAKVMGGYVSCEGDYPAWEYKKQSHLRDLMQELHKEKFDAQPATGTIHAGLECGIFSANLYGLDCVSIGPNIHDIHTPAEAMELDSFKRCYELVVAVLERLQ